MDQGGTPPQPLGQDTQQQQQQLPQNHNHSSQ